MTKIIYLVLIYFCFLSCTNEKTNSSNPDKVTIQQSEDGFQLLVNDQPFFIKGARTIGKPYVDMVAKIGGNSIRIGSNNAQEQLDEAHKHGLKVLFGLPVKSERNGFDYNNSEAVKAQFDTLKGMVLQYKDHPAILMWAIGNEMDYIPGDANYNLKLWDAVNDIAKMIHEVDPNHPAITVVGTGRKEKMADIVELLPDIDAIGINSYKDIYDVPNWVREYKLNKPYVITEWGPTGDWQVPKNKWKLPIEETTTEKAQAYLDRHQKVIENDPYCLGGYSFLWTHGRQERTHTWYNLFHDGGEATEGIDVLQYVWTGEWPENRAPKIDSVIVNGQRQKADISLHPRINYQATVFAHDTDNDSLSYEWELYPENTKFGYAGQGETRPQTQNHLIANRLTESIEFTAPEAGNYRLFVYVRDNNHKIAMANVAFHVEEGQVVK